MADFRRRSEHYDHEYDRDPRGSFPNLTWRGNDPAYRRPPVGPRSHTTDPKRVNQTGSVDRRPSINMNDASRPHANAQSNGNPKQAETATDPRKKRNPDRSPEGGSERKKMRSDQESLFMPSNTSGSPRSSIVNDRSRETSVTVPTPLSTHSRRQSMQVDKGTASSPARVSAAATNDVDDSKPTEMNDTAKNALVILSNLNSDSAVLASLQLRKDDAAAQLNKARLEYDVHRSNFKTYPSLKEAKERNKNAARKEVESHDKRLSEHKATQQQTLESLASLIGQASEVKPRTDVVAREEYNSLKVKLETLERNLQTTKDLAGTVNTDVAANIADIAKKVEGAESNANQVPRIWERLRRAEDDADALLKWKEQSIDDNQKQDDNMQKLVTASDRAQKDIDQLKIDVKRYTPRKTHDELEAKYETLAQKTVGMDRSNKELHKTFDQLKALKTGSNITTNAANKVTDLEKSLNDLKSRVGDLQESIKGDGNSALALHMKNDPLSKTVTELQDQLKQLYHEFRAVQATVKSVNDGALPEINASSVELVKRLNRMEADLKSLDTQQTEKDDILAEGIELRLQPHEARIASVEAASTANEQHTKDVAASNEKNLEALHVIVNTKVPRDEFNLLKKQHSALFEEVKKLQSQQHRASTSNSPVPSGLPQRPNQSPQMPNGAFATPQMPNGIAASPQLPNSVGPHRTVSPLNNSNTQGLVHSPTKQGEMQLQLDQLVGVTQHLKQRADNIQSDEIARLMVDQVSQMYPALKNTDLWIQDCNKRVLALGGQLHNLRGDKDKAVKELNALVSAAQSSATNATNEARTALEKATKTGSMVNDVENLKGSVGSLSKDMNVKFSEIGGTLEGHGRLISSTKEELSKTNSSIEHLTGEVSKGSASVERLEQALE